jgi:hypothetical protein
MPDADSGKGLVIKPRRLERVQMLEAMAVAFGAMVVLSLTGGLLDAADLGDPRQSLQVTFIAGVLIWVVALMAGTHRKR